MASVDVRITAEEFGQRPDDGRSTELVRGRIVELPPPKRRHGQVCQKISMIIGIHVEARDLGHVLINDTGIITGRDPDTVRGADIAYYSYARLPKGPVPDSYSDVPPEIVFEVRSPSDRWREIHVKVAEYLHLGVLFVCVLDPDSQSIHIHRTGVAPEILGAGDELTFPGWLPDFRESVRRFFE